MPEREPISRKIRFEVFKRDGFKCQYCGRSAPEVVLEVDHIKPVKEGGTNDITNLITSCKDCNRGKGTRLLDDKTILEKQKQQLEELNEKREQLEMLVQWKEELLQLEDKQFDYIVSYWEKLTESQLNNTQKQELKKLVRKYSLNDILEAIDRATDYYLKVENSRNINTQYTYESILKAFDYISKICNMLQQEKEKPYLKDLAYIQGILRKRLYLPNSRLSFKYLEEAYLAGASIESLTIFAKEVRSWSDFENAIKTFLKEVQNG